MFRSKALLTFTVTTAFFIGNIALAADNSSSSSSSSRYSGHSTTTSTATSTITTPTSSSSTTSTSSTKQKDIRYMTTQELAKRILVAGSENRVDELADKIIEYLKQQEELIQAKLAYLRGQEQEAYAERAKAKGKPLGKPLSGDKTGYQEAYDEDNRQSAATAKAKYENAPQNFIHKHEQLLSKVHFLMGEVEKIRETKLNLLKNSNEQLKNTLKTMVTDFNTKYLEFDKLISLHIGQMHVPDQAFYHSMNTSICPDKEIVGKKVIALFPHFSMDQWNSQPINIRTGAFKAPLAQIRLQGKLWNVFVGRSGNQTPYNPPAGAANLHHHHPMAHGPIQPGNDILMEFIPRTNPKSKICEYSFYVQGKDQWGSYQYGQHPGGGWGPMKTSYSLIFIPADDEEYVKSANLHDHLLQMGHEEDLAAEGLEVPDVSNPEESRAAVHDEMRRRLAERQSQDARKRRLHRRKIPAEQGHEVYLQPSDVMDQNAGRLRIRLHFHKRFQPREGDLGPAITANQDLIKAAEMERVHREEMRGYATPEGSGEKNQ